MHATNECSKVALRDVLDRVRTGYSALEVTLATSYCNRLTASMLNAKSKCEYFVGCCIRVGEKGYVLSIENAYSDEKRGDGLTFRRCRAVVVSFT